jgi:hypothetical protein
VPAGRAAAGLGAADWNSDGLIDLALVSHSDATLVTFRNQGDGTFVEEVVVALAETPGVSRFGDVDGDDLPDLVYSTHSGSSIRARMAGTGATFESERTIAVLSEEATAEVVDLTLRDLNADGILDVIAVTVGQSAIVALLGRGNGVFDEAVERGTSVPHLAVAVGDVSRDGVPDVVTVTTGLGNSELVVVESALSLPESVDCNSNGVPDACDIARGESSDDNQNGVPDVCERARFHRGDPNGDDTLDISDGAFIFEYLFLGGGEPGCLESADANNDGTLDISDGIVILNYLFLGGVAPDPPGPPGADCGVDPDPLGSEADLGCQTPPPC